MSHFCRYCDRTLLWKMNDNPQVEVHYINTGFPYTVTESFMDLFEGLTYTPADFFLAGAWPEQEQVMF